MISARLALGAMALGAGVAVTVLHAPPAQAMTDAAESYLQQIRDNGVVIANEASTLSNGYEICKELPRVNGEDLAQALIKNGGYGDIEVARIEIVSAAMNLCPDQWHPTSDERFTPVVTVPVPSEPVGRVPGGKKVGGAIGKGIGD